jgi:hypothetical protein
MVPKKPRGEMQLPGGNEELGSQKLGILTSAKAMIGDALHERSE